MSQLALQADSIAEFLEQNPQFFLEHEYLLSSIRLPHPRTEKVISLAERQTMHLRKKNQQLERQITQFIHTARENELISQALLNWTCELLAFKGDCAQVILHLGHSLKEQYGLQDVVLHLWDSAFAATAPSSSSKQWVQQLLAPYTGPTANIELAQWFKQPMASMAVIPLYAPRSRNCVGALALGSDVAHRFTYNLGTDFLEAMGQIVIAMLARYHESTQ